MPAIIIFTGGDNIHDVLEAVPYYPDQVTSHDIFAKVPHLHPTNVRRLLSKLRHQGEIECEKGHVPKWSPTQSANNVAMYFYYRRAAK